MSSNEHAIQFIPPALKKISIGFFSLTIIGIIAVLLLSPQFSHDQIKSATDQSLADNSFASPPDTNFNAATNSAELLIPNLEPSPLSPHSINAIEDSPPSPTPIEEVQSSDNNLEHCQYSGSQTPKILGVKYQGHLYFYSPGSQLYYAVQERLKIERRFCHESTAIQQGWVKGPDTLTKLDQRESQQKDDTGGLIPKVLNILGM